MTQIVRVTVEDLPRLARCHCSAFPKTLSTAMGQKYVEKMLEWYLVDKRSFIFALQENNGIVGYCGGLKFDGLARVGSASSMIQHSYNLAVKTFLMRPWLFLHPEFISKYKLAVKNVWRRIKRRLGISIINAKSGNHELPQPHTGLIVIGVDPAFQGKGYGSLLLKEFEIISAGLGYVQMMLTVRTDNLQAIRSYSKNGWQVTYQDEKSTTMEKRIDQSTSLNFKS